MITIDKIRENIQKAIKLSGLTQTELAKKIQIKQQSLSQYLSGRSLPALDTFANLCIVLDLDANEILGITKECEASNNITNSFNNNSGNISFNS